MASLTAPTLPRYVELVRVSSAGQAEDGTPADQVHALERLAATRPGSLVERLDYGARGLSGAKGFSARPDLQRLAELARAKAFDELRVRAIDRLTRHTDPRERFAIYGMVADAGAIIVDASGHTIDPTTELGEVDYFLQTWMAAKERKKIAERTRAGALRAVAAGRLAGGRPPYGRTFDKRTGDWGVDPHLADVYRRIFAWCIEGRSQRWICRALEDEGEPAPRGGVRWSDAQVSRLLHSEAAIGVYRGLGVTMKVPPIVDPATRDAAIARLKANRTQSGPPARVWALLRKIATCATCGSPMYVTLGSARRAHYYRCASKGPCAVHHQVGRVDTAVQEVLAAFVRRPGALAAAAALELPADDGSAERDGDEARAELADLDRQEERVARLLRRELVSETTGEKQLEEVARLRAAARARLAEAEARQAAAARRQEVAAALEGRLQQLRAGVASSLPETWRELCEILFPRSPTTWVRIHEDGRIELCGTVPLDDVGEAALTRRGETPASPNRDGSTTLLLDAFPIGTNKLQIREERERDFAPRAANGNGLAAAPYAGNAHAAGEEAES